MRISNHTGKGDIHLRSPAEERRFSHVLACTSNSTPLGPSRIGTRQREDPAIGPSQGVRAVRQSGDEPALMRTRPAWSQGAQSSSPPEERTSKIPLEKVSPSAGSEIQTKAGALDAAEPNLLWVHGGAGFLDIAMEILSAFKTNGLVGNNQAGSVGRPPLNAPKRPQLKLRAISNAALYNCFRATAYVQPFLDPVGGAASLAFILSEFIPTKEANTTIKDQANIANTRTTLAEVGVQSIKGEGETDISFNAGGGFGPIVTARTGKPNPKPFSIPSMGTLAGNRADGMFMVDFQLWSNPKVGFIRVPCLKSQLGSPFFPIKESYCSIQSILKQAVPEVKCLPLLWTPIGEFI